MMIFLFILLAISWMQPVELTQQKETAIIHELFRFRNEHKADSAELLYADTVLVYMKTLRNVPRKTITKLDKQFWKAHPRNRFDMTAPVEIKVIDGRTTAIIYGNEFLDGTSSKKERIEIKFDSRLKINHFRAFNVK